MISSVPNLIGSLMTPEIVSTRAVTLSSAPNATASIGMSVALAENAAAQRPTASARMERRDTVMREEYLGLRGYFGADSVEEGGAGSIAAPPLLFPLLVARKMISPTRSSSD